MPRDFVQARKRVRLYLPFAFIDDRRGACNATEEQNEALREFLVSTSGIPSKVTRHQGKATHGGSYFITSLREAIRTTIREHGHSKRHKANPVASCFYEGRDAVNPEYQQRCIEAFHLHERKPTLYDTGPETS